MTKDRFHRTRVALTVLALAIVVVAIIVFLAARGVHGRSETRSSRCNPLSNGDCLLPYPSSFFTKKDPSTATGLRVDLSGAALPVSRFGARLDPTPHEERDGFSPVTPILAELGDRTDPSQLIPPSQTRRALLASSPVQLIHAASGRRVPVFAEVDANAGEDEPQALIIQPAERLEPASRYIVVLRNFRNQKGELIARPPGFARQANEGGALFTRLRELGVDDSSLQLAWEFPTASDTATLGRLLELRDRAAKLAARVEVNQVRENPRELPGIWRQIRATLVAPSFLTSDGNRLQKSPEGNPEHAGPGRFELTIHVPDCAKALSGQRLPVLLYGHGTFNTARREMSTPYSREILNKLCRVEVGLDWLGRARQDLPYFLTRVLTNWSNFQQITDRLQQSHVNLGVLARLIHQGGLESLGALRVNGQPLIDSRKIQYYGISEGGCQGVTALALSPEIERGALNVPCGFWSMFFWRSSDFYHVRRALKLSYPSALEQQKLLALTQLLFDYTEPANFAPHVLRDPLPGSRVKPVLYQEGIGDASVPNLTTRAMARTLGLPQRGTRFENVEGIRLASAPVASAYSQFLFGAPAPLGANNVPPPVNPIHEGVRRLSEAQEQLIRFLDGKAL